MGNAESNESAAVKRQAEGGSVPMYELFDLSGGGSLIPITKRAMVKKDFKELDETLKAKLPEYLYNGGEGKMVPIAQLTMLRNRDRPPSKQLPVIKELGEAAFNYVFEDSEVLAKVTEGLDPETSPHLFRECCWMVEKRGFVGETVFHVCFLMQTSTHLACARRMLKLFPKLINDIYISEEYYGENVLHMAAVAEDPTMVKHLLEQGVEVHDRAYGNFFACDDQKASRMDSLDHEEVDVCLKSNYFGFAAWGEYSHSFAAFLNQEECYRLILNKGANHDLQDSNGNTVTHIMVVYNNMRMFDLAVECGASINMLNRQELTPLSMAAYLAKPEMFFHIANLEREVYWQIGNVTCSAYPIEQLDSINSSTGELNTVSALNLIVFGPKVEHLDLIEGIIVDILLTKWKSFVRASFFRQFFSFAVFFLLSSFVFVTRPPLPYIPDCANSTLNSSLLDGMGINQTLGVTPIELPTLPMTAGEDGDTDVTRPPDVANSTASGGMTTLMMDEDIMMMTTPSGDFAYFINGSRCRLKGAEPQIDPADLCFRNTYDTPMSQMRVISEIVLVIWSVLYLVKAAREATFLERKVYIQSMALCPSRVVFLLGCAVMVLNVPLRLACKPKEEDTLAITVMLCTGPYFLFFCRGFKLTGPFVSMIYRMIANDLIRFCSIFFIFVMGFSQAYYIIFQSYSGDDHPMPSAIESIIGIFIMSLGNFGDYWDGLEDTGHEFAGQAHAFLFLAIVYVLLVNLLIAMMGDTYTRIAEIKNEWMRQWARIVLLVERGIPPAERLKQQDLYAERMATGQKALVLKQTMSPEQLEEIKDIVEMKVTHRRNIIKREKKFGYKSNSTIGLDLAGAAANVIAPDADDPDDMMM